MGPQVQPKCFRHVKHMRNNWELRKRGYLIRFGHTEALLFFKKKKDIKRPFFPPCRNWPIYGGTKWIIQYQDFPDENWFAMKLRWEWRQWNGGTDLSDITSPYSTTFHSRNNLMSEQLKKVKVIFKPAQTQHQYNFGFCGLQKHQLYKC